MARKKSNKQYKLMAKSLRSLEWVDEDGVVRHSKLTNAFDASKGFDLRKANSWTPAQKAQVTRYFKEVEKQTAKPFYIYRPRKKSRLKKAQSYSQQQKGLPALNVAFVPTDGDTKPDITFTSKGNIRVKIHGIGRVKVDIDTRYLALHPRAAIEEAQETVPKAGYFTIQAGLYEVNNVFQRGESLHKAIAWHQKKYDSGNHDWRNWLHGVIAYEVPKADLGTISDMMYIREQAKKALQGDRRRLKRRYWDKIKREKEIKKEAKRLLRKANRKKKGATK